jgi:outer membrane murein-binding lipoprotein Lpp
VPPAAGAISTDLAELHAAVGRFTRDAGAARAAGQAAREAARARYGLDRFLLEWDQLLQEVGG